MYIANASPIITNNVIAYNAQLASGKGGGIYFSNCNSQRFSGNLICNNVAYTGGAINLNDADILFVNNIFVNNQAYYGGAMFVLQSTPVFVNNTIAYNKATSEGGGIVFSLNSNASFINNIIGRNKDGNSVNQVYFYTTPGTQSFQYCDIEGDTADFEFGGAWTYTGSFINNVDTMPELVNPTADADYTLDALHSDWNLLNTSPCINKGKPDTTGLNLLPYDFYGNTRIFGDTVDIGAAEFSCATFQIDLGEDTVVCADQSINFDLGTSYDSLMWMNSSTDSQITFDSLGTGVGTLQVYVTVYSGICSASDTMYVTFDVCTGIGVDPVNNEPGFIYNMIGENIYYVDNSLKGRWSIFSIDGRLMKAASNANSINVADLSPGIYIVRSEINSVPVIRKISVQ